LDSFKQRARKAIVVTVFSAAFLLPCGFVEGFVSPKAWIPTMIKCAIGMTICAIYWKMLLGKGKKVEV